MTRPDSTTVANRLIAYLYRTGPLDWAGGRWALWERRWGRVLTGGFDDILKGFEGVKSEVVNVSFSAEEAAEIRGDALPRPQTPQTYPLYYRPGAPTGSSMPSPSVPLFSTRAAVEALKKPIAVDGVFKLTAMRVSIPFGPPELPQFGPNPPPKPHGFWPLIDHNFSIGYDGDIRTCRDEAEQDGDTEAVEICDQLLSMKRTAREKCGHKVDAAVFKRGNR